MFCGAARQGCEVDRIPYQPSPAFEPNRVLEKFRKPQYAVPAAIVAGMLAIVGGVQPGSTPTSARFSRRGPGDPGTGSVIAHRDARSTRANLPSIAEATGARSTPDTTPTRACVRSDG